jgi:hypothetical protein
MHPTAGTLPVIFARGAAAAGDAGRYAAYCVTVSMPFYTFIMEYAGGTHVSQVTASSPKSACVKWAQELDVSQVSGLGQKSKETLIEKMKAEAPTALSGLANSWCATALIRGELALINIVQTERDKKPS